MRARGGSSLSWRKSPAGENKLWDGARVYRLAPDGSLNVLANCEYPNGLALSPDERTMYVANTRSSQYIHAIPAR
jgi:sugar lactone lactonase YvrE